LRKIKLISEKLQHIQLSKFAVFIPPVVLPSLPSMNKIGDGMVFSLVHLTWNDPADFFNPPKTKIKYSPEGPKRVIYDPMVFFLA
jgi:hypothetical protein